MQPCNQNIYYADFVSIPGHPEYDNRFFNVFAEVRDLTGYEWYPSFDVPTTVSVGTAQLKRAFESMALASLVTHEYYIQDISPASWTAINAGIAANISADNPEYVTMDHAVQYVRAMVTSDIGNGTFDPATNVLNVTLTGNADLETRFYLFTDDGSGIASQYVYAPSFNGSTSVQVNVSSQPPVPTSTPTSTPVTTNTPTSTPAAPTATNTPAATATNMPTATPNPSGEIKIDVWNDANQSPALLTTSNVADLSPSDNQWTEFLWAARGYPGVFAGFAETQTVPLMRFYAAVPNGTYAVNAGLYWNSNIRYYWGYTSANPQAFSGEVQSGTSGDFAEYGLGSVTVTNGIFELYTQRADALPGAGDYPFYGWAWVKLIPQSASTPAATPTNTPAPTNTPVPTSTPTSTPVTTNTPTSTPAVPTATNTPAATATNMPTATPNPSGEIKIDVWNDANQSPALLTTSNVADLSPSDNQWTEFLWAARGYPGVFAGFAETQTVPLMRFYAAVPNGTYAVNAGLYWNSNIRYYWGYTSANPQAFSGEVQSGTSGDFAEYGLGSVTVTNGIFELYTQRADALPGAGDYPFYGWAWVKLIPQSASTPAATPTNTPAPTNTPVPTSTPTSTPAAPTATSTPAATATNTPAPIPDLIFKDGFELGTLASWTSSVTGGTDLSAATSAALVGTRGMRAVINDNTPIYVTDDSPTAETRYRMRFYFDPNSISMSNGNAHYIFYAYAGSTTVVQRIEFRRSSSVYQVRASVMNDASTWTSTSWWPISDAPHYVEIDWRSATSAGANDGSLTLWVDGSVVGTVSGLDNDSRRIDRVRLGPVNGIDTGTRGTYYFDAFESRRQSSIGIATQ